MTSQHADDIDMTNATSSDTAAHQADQSESQSTEAEKRPTDINELNKIIDTLEAERSDLSGKLDKIMRAYAEAENRSKRAEKDKIDAIKYGPMKLARDLLEVADNFERALKAFPQERNVELKEVYEGLELTEKSLHQVLSRYGVKQVETENVIFDPNFHEAVTQIQIPDKKTGEIIDVVRKGYLMEERLLRPAQVITAT